MAATDATVESNEFELEKLHWLIDDMKGEMLDEEEHARHAYRMLKDELQRTVTQLHGVEGEQRLTRRVQNDSAAAAAEGERESAGESARRVRMVGARAEADGGGRGGTLATSAASSSIQAAAAAGGPSSTSDSTPRRNWRSE